MGNFTAKMAFHSTNGWSTTHPGNFLAHPLVVITHKSELLLVEIVDS